MKEELKNEIQKLKAQKEELEKRYYEVSLDPIFDPNNEWETLYDKIWELKKQIKKLKRLI